ncbi:MAG: flagellar filament capping protein FliD [Chloroflexota bacterium]
MAINPTSSSLFSFSGLVSGMNTTDIISKLMSLESMPLTALQTKQSQLTARDQAYSDLSGKLSALQTAAMTLLQPSAVNAKTATPSVTGVLTATANSSAINGTFSVLVNRLATATSVSTSKASAPGSYAASAVGQAASSTAVLNAAGLTNAPTAGTFSINGKSITIDPTVDTLNSVISKINGSGAGVTASLANDQYGRANVLQLTGTSIIQLGAGSDTSNFLSAVGLVANGTSTVQSGLLGTAQTGAALSSANLTTAVAASGTFSVNGVAVSWSNTDSLSTVLGRINSAGAGVTATYDPNADRVTLTNIATGNQAISLSDTTGNFLQAMGLVDPATSTTVSQNYGQTASFSLNGAAAQYSNSNTVSGVVPGVTLNLQSAQASGATPVTVTVGQDTTTSGTNLTAFANAFNALTDAISSYTAISSTTNQPSVLTGDPSVQGLDATIRRLLYTPATGISGQYRSLADIGLSTGTYGAALNTTNHLVLDQNKLSAALNNNPSQVQSVIAGVMTSLTQFTTPTLASGGLFDSEKTSFASQQHDLSNQITNMQNLLSMRQQSLQAQFTAMEQAMAQLQGQGSQLISAMSSPSPYTPTH